MGKAGEFVRYQLPAVIWAALIFVSSSIPASHYPAISIAGIDKLVHFTIYGTLCLLTFNAVRHQQLFPFFARYAALASLLLIVLFGLIDELHQLGVPGRAFDPTDLLADFLGGSLCLSIVWLYGRIAARRVPER